jgi:hypothetical protein
MLSKSAGTTLPLPGSNISVLAGYSGVFQDYALK